MVSQLDNLNRLLMAYRVTYCDAVIWSQSGQKRKLRDHRKSVVHDHSGQSCGNHASHQTGDG